MPSYGSLESGVPLTAPSNIRRALVIVAALSAVTLGCILLIGTQRHEWSALEQRVVLPPNDFTASKDMKAYDSYFSQLNQKAKEQEAAFKSGETKATYKSTNAARNEIDSFFDNLPVGKKAKSGLSAKQAEAQLDDIFPTHEKKVAQREHEQGLSAKQAEAQLNDIFPTHEQKVAQIEREQDQKAQKLAMSADKAQDDLDSYFDSLPTVKHTAHKVSDESDSTRSYIEAKRAAMEKGGSFTEVTKDGQVIKTADKWSGAEARKQLDDMFGGEVHQRRNNHAQLNSYEQEHPGFQKQLEMVRDSCIFSKHLYV
jgi:hypothetical protein